MAADDSTIDRAEIAADLERARVEFHRLLVEAERHDAWTKPTCGTRWTNEQLLFHMVFGYMVVQRLLVLVKVFSRLPDGVSRVFARSLNAATSHSMSSTTTAPARPPWSTTATGWAQRWTG